MMIARIEAILKERFGRAVIWQEIGKDYYLCNIPYQAFIDYAVANGVALNKAIPDNLQWQGGASNQDYIDTTDKEQVLFFIVTGIVEDSK